MLAAYTPVTPRAKITGHHAGDDNDFSPLVSADDSEREGATGFSRHRATGQRRSFIAQVASPGAALSYKTCRRAIYYF